jgi:hypothetical protein
MVLPSLIVHFVEDFLHLRYIRSSQYLHQSWQRAVLLVGVIKDRGLTLVYEQDLMMAIDLSLSLHLALLYDL